ncbi:unnamed protein product [Eruca vesicaria subsp. sativa]|uniref:long-chain-alcohol O-fatty-acyltransferase n=1 Tax=Eruca vesicaria subsp. sativa TaxID=29727 RepID=A0ABC8J605_ERUVS|nr:unnamed protein product [Eruca vesicaria subsp. sativa]
MEEEIKRFVLVYISAIISVSYCYYIPSRIKAGVPRLLSILPVCVQFFVFPMLFYSALFTSTIMFTLTGMGTLKLLLFAFDKGPLFPIPTSLFRFMCFTFFPIERLRKNPKSQSTFPTWVFSTKVAICAVMSMLHVQGYKHNLPTVLLWVLYPLYMYLPLDIIFNIMRFLFTIILGCDLEPVFDEPYLATSLQDFWGRRWNLMVSSVLRSAFYLPLVGKSNSGLVMFIGSFTTFVASGLFHELLYFYTSHETPSGEITLFYVLHGVCTAIEMVLKRSTFGQRWAVRPVVSRLLTMTFMIVTSGWLYFPQITRGNEICHYITEYFIVS